METIFDYLERIVLCLSPLIIAWFGYRASKNEKQTKKYIESQEELKKANAKIKEQERQEMQQHFDKLDKSISALANKVDGLEKSIVKIEEIDNRLGGLVNLSNVNFEFCTSLSSVIYSIGNALDSSDTFKSETLHSDLNAHQERERELIKRVCKIVY